MSNSTYLLSNSTYLLSIDETVTTMMSPRYERFKNLLMSLFNVDLTTQEQRRIVYHILRHRTISKYQELGIIFGNIIIAKLETTSGVQGFYAISSKGKIARLRKNQVFKEKSHA